MKIIALSLLLLFAPASPWAGGPSISPEKPVFHFGQIAEGSRLEHTFRFKNSGDSTLIINKVRSSCGCTAALLSSDSIPPGGFGEVKTVFDSNGFSGSVVKTIFLHTNDPLQKTVRFQLQGQVQKEIEVLPSRLQFSNLDKKTPSRAKVVLTNKGSNTLFLSDLKTTSRQLVAELSQEKLGPEETVEIEITLTPEEDKARFAGYITLKTSSPRTPMLRIPVTGHRVE
ncbi:MAG: DUF1573 domain-containing protein [Syntrophotaleaceae bacterium]